MIAPVGAVDEEPECVAERVDGREPGEGGSVAGLGDEIPGVRVVGQAIAGEDDAGHGTEDGWGVREGGLHFNLLF